MKPRGFVTVAASMVLTAVGQIRAVQHKAIPVDYEADDVGQSGFRHGPGDADGFGDRRQGFRN